MKTLEAAWIVFASLIGVGFIGLAALVIKHVIHNPSALAIFQSMVFTPAALFGAVIFLSGPVAVVWDKVSDLRSPLNK